MLAIVVSLVGAGCGSDDNSGSSNGVATLEKGKLKVGSDIPYPPFEFGEAPYQGFDVDFVNEIAKRPRAQAEFLKTPFDRDLPQPRAGPVRHGGLGIHDHAASARRRSTSRIRTSQRTSR